MKLEEVLSVAEIETPRSPRVFVEWFDGLLSRTEKIEDEEFNTQMLTHAGLAKRFYEEVFPLYRLVQTKLDSWSGVCVMNVLGNQPYDVKLMIEGDDRPNVPRHLEITYAVTGREHFDRMGYFAENGTTVGWNPNQATTPPEPLARDCDETVEKTFALVKERINKKTGSDYGDRVGLIIYVEDEGEFKYSSERQSRLENFFSSHWCQINKAFQASYLITSFEGKVFELPVLSYFKEGDPKN